MSDRGIAADGPFEKVLKVSTVLSEKGRDTKRVMTLRGAGLQTFKTLSHSATHCLEHLLDRAKE